MDCNGVIQLDGVYKKGYGTVPKFVMHDPDLSIESKSIYAYLCALAGNGNCTFPYRDTILRHLGFSKNTYYRHYKPLIDQGYITVRRPHDKSAANIYTLVSNPKKLTEKNKYADSDSRLRYIGLKSHGYGSIPKSVMMDENLSPKSKGLYAYLCSYCGSGDSAFPKRDDIIFHLGISEPTYYKCYNQLRELGYLVAIQRKYRNKFGINDYYLNGNVSDCDETGTKKCDIVKSSLQNESTDLHTPDKTTLSYQKIKDTKIRDIDFRDIRYGDNNINNNNSKINNSKNSLSNMHSEKEGRSQIIGQIKQVFNTILSDDKHPYGYVIGCSENKRKEILEGFIFHFQEKSKNKQIHNLPSYIKVSLINWLESDFKRIEKQQKSIYKKISINASYDINVMENQIECGNF